MKRQDGNLIVLAPFGIPMPSLSNLIITGCAAVIAKVIGAALIVAGIVLIARS